MKIKLNTSKPDEIIECINQTEFAGMVSYDKKRKCLFSLVKDLYVYFDVFHQVLEIKRKSMSNKKVNQISDESLIKCMKDYLEWPAKYHPEYLELLLNDYERRVNMKMPTESPLPPCREFPDIDTSTNATIKIP